MKYLKMLFPMLSVYKKNILAIFLCLFLSASTGFVVPFITQKIYDEGIAKKKFDILIILCVILFVIYIVNSINIIIKEKNRIKIYNGIRYDMQKDAFIHLTKIKMDFFKDKNPVNVFQTIKEDITAISDLVHSSTFTLLTGILTALGGGAALFIMNWQLGLVTLIFIPVNILFTRNIIKKIRPVSKEFIEKNRSYNEWFGDCVNGIMEVRLFGLEKTKEAEISSRHSTLIELSGKRSMLQICTSEIQTILLNSLSILIYIVAGIIMLFNNISVGKVVAFESTALMFTQPITYGVNMLFKLSNILPSIQRHYEFTNYEEEQYGENKDIATGDIVFENVSFRYINEKTLFENLSFTIKEQSKIGIIGKNGTGKTTLTNLILRILNPDSGRILLNGTDISDYDIYEYRKMFSVVTQNTFLFNMSIRDNICLDQKISEEQFEQIVDKVNLRSLINERGSGFIVGANGGMLSGGQKQKISLARALIQNRPFVILDEATSNLDVETIEIFSELFNTELKNKTVICITHKDAIKNLMEDFIEL